ncbi:MAG: RNase adapter RapZ [Oligoflexales bacterium]|nr:RNase adapter RapZ [Oligoflexales bacterium]
MKNERKEVEGKREKEGFERNEQSEKTREGGAKAKLVLIVGMSGSGLGTAIRALEDIGFYCIDNLPFELIEKSVEILSQNETQKNLEIAIGVHIQSNEQAAAFKEMKKNLQKKTDLECVFLKAKEDALLDRFSVNRRRHPFLSKTGNIVDALRAERAVMQYVEMEADKVFDTSSLIPHDFVRLIQSSFQKNISRKLFVNIMSFGFKFGCPRSLDSLFDVRFLKNPYFVTALKDKTGLDPDVKIFLKGEDPHSDLLLQKLIDWHLWVLPKYYEEGKHDYKIGIGCTGGQHRSVYIAEELIKRLQDETENLFVFGLHHRDVYRSKSGLR